MEQAGRTGNLTTDNLFLSAKEASQEFGGLESSGWRAGSASTGSLIINGDDWGRNRETTDRTLDCIRAATMSGVSAMMFMEDSERAAEIAREHGVDTGLHLNFTEPFSAKHCSRQFADRQNRVSAYLRCNSLARVFSNFGLRQSFEYLVAAQLDEYRRLYGKGPKRFDGHHHQHLCANVVYADLLPAGTLVRRNFSFAAGEKSWVNRLYRKAIDRRLARNHDLVDFLFSMKPLEPVSRLQRIFSIARHSLVELETHPVVPEEHRFLTSGEILPLLGDVKVALNFTATVAEARRLQ
jgi:chitin disaccharide deacetylase